ncbi:hypothetical protein IWQ60_008824 [Tieghemiomyces parasiticus]|uniref:5-hydroxyisourate hydrolase n=1 Tax=Tieghemiomyces parasiticus TaxID=78921 RepID=A0A9W7ZRB2_9FUNG|nr:hypothetical protein IWQ60_008824 [Tieghemiomyces parasiticus]
MAARSPITTHILDGGRGAPASGVQVILFHEDPSSQTYRGLAESLTDQNGRCEQLLPPGTSVATGNYYLRFKTRSYFQTRGESSFYPFIDIHFEVTDPTQHHHVPLLLNNYSYSTYRGC